MAGLSLNRDLDALLAAVREALPAPTPRRAVVAPGASVAWDDCCDGQVWVRVVSVTPVYPAKGPPGCGPTRWDLTLGVGVLRCAATLDDEGRAPRPRAITADGHEMVDDMNAIATFVQCTSDLPLDPRLVQWSPLGPNGGCHGGEWTMRAAVLS